MVFQAFLNSAKTASSQIIGQVQLSSLKQKNEKKKVINFNNDASINEVFVDFELGGFDRQKAMYMLRKND